MKNTFEFEFNNNDLYEIIEEIIMNNYRERVDNEKL